MDKCPFCASTQFRSHNGRPGAVCVECGALERHRALFGRLKAHGLLERRGRCLDVAPLNERVFGDTLRSRGWDHVGIDKWRTGNPRDPRAVGFIDHEADLCDLSLFEDGTFDLIIVQHVIEEIPDFRRALSELRRVLAPDGWAFLEVPWDHTEKTSVRHDPNAFGNVWRFGKDLLDHMRFAFGRVDVEILEEAAYRHSVFVIRPGWPRAGQRVFMAHGHDEEFRANLTTLLRYMREHDLRSLDGDAFLAGDPGVLITFDDGHFNDYEIAYPLLREYGAHALSFLIPLHSTTHPRVTDWPAWREVADRIEVGSHSLTHSQVGTERATTNATPQGGNVVGFHGHETFAPRPALTAQEFNAALGRLETGDERQARLQTEIGWSRLLLERNLGRPVRFFSYPWGAFDSSVIEIVKRSGYEAAFATQQSDGDRWAIPRIDLPRYDFG